MLSPPRKKPRCETEETPVCNEDFNEEQTNEKTQRANATIAHSEPSTASGELTQQAASVDSQQTELCNTDQIIEVVQQEKQSENINVADIDKPIVLTPSLQHLRRCSLEPISENLNSRCLLFWPIQAFHLIYNQLKSFSCSCQLFQLPNSVLVQLSNDLMDLMEWLDIESTTSVNVSKATLLSLLYDIGQYQTTAKVTETTSQQAYQKYILRNDAVTTIVDDKIVLSTSGIWRNPMLAKAILKQPDTGNSQRFNSAKLHDFFLSGYYPKQDAPELNSTTIFTLGIVAMIADIWCELWNRVTAVVIAMDTEPLNQLLIEGGGSSNNVIELISKLDPLDKPLADRDTRSFNERQQSEQLPGIPLFLVMFYGLFINEGTLLLTSAKLPSDFDRDVQSALNRLKQIQHQIDEHKQQLQPMDHNQVLLQECIPNRDVLIHGSNIFDDQQNKNLQKSSKELSRAQEPSADLETSKPIVRRRGRPRTVNYDAPPNVKSCSINDGIERSLSETDIQTTDIPDVSEIAYHRPTNSCWLDGETGKRRYKYFSSKIYGSEIAKRNTEKERRKIMRPKEVESAKMDNKPSREEQTKITYTAKTGYWTCRDKDKRSLCFNIRHFGMSGAEKLARLASHVFANKKRRTQIITRSDVFEEYQRIHGSLPTRDDEDDDDDVDKIIIDEDEDYEEQEKHKDEGYNDDDEGETTYEEDSVETVDVGEMMRTQEDEDDCSVEASVNAAGISGIAYNRNTQNWTAKITVDGIIRSCNWASKKYGFEKARQLALLAKKKADEMGYFPSRESMLQSLEEKQENDEISNCVIRSCLNPLADYSQREEIYSLDDCNQYTRNEDDDSDDKIEHIPGVTYLPRENAWRCKWWSKSENRQITRTYYVSRYGYEEAKKLAVECRNEKERDGESVKRPPSAQTGICYDNESECWIARWRRKAVSFNITEYGDDLAKHLCQIARKEAETTGELPLKENVIGMFQQNINRTNNGNLDDELVNDLSLLLQPALVGEKQLETNTDEDQTNEILSSEELAQLSLELLSGLILTEEEKTQLKDPTIPISTCSIPSDKKVLSASHDDEDQQGTQEIKQPQKGIIKSDNETEPIQMCNAPSSIQNMQYETLSTQAKHQKHQLPWIGHQHQNLLHKKSGRLIPSYPSLIFPQQQLMTSSSLPPSLTSNVGYHHHVYQQYH